MSNLKISTHPTSGISCYIANDGRAFYTATLLAKLMGIETRVLTQSRTFKGVINYASEFASALTNGGFQGVISLILAEDAYDIVDAYCTVARTDCSQAKELRKAMGRMGSVAYAYSICGYEMKSVIAEPPSPKLPQTYLEALKCLVASEEEKLALQAQIEADLPATELGKAIAECKGVKIEVYAKSINMGRNKCFKMLRELGFIQPVGNSLPYQKHIDNGNFTVSSTVKTDSYGNSKQYSFALITGKGELAVQRAINKRDRKENAINQLSEALDAEIVIVN